MICIWSFLWLLRLDVFNFLWHQIRRIIGALQNVAQGKCTKHDITYALDHPEETIDYGLASADSLVLKDVLYPFKFTHDRTMFSQMHQFEEQLRTALMKSS